jgi:5-methylcytosine-specific restriction endonuclease McrA
MPWLRIDDRLAMSVKVRGLVDDGVTGERAKDQRNATLGHWLQILTWVAGERTDGYVTTDVVREYGTRATTARLLRARFDRAPLLHQRGADGSPPPCPCLDGRVWPADFAYAIHDYLDRNPSRAENDVHRAKKRELRDAKLKRAVRDRDHDRCRYCGKTCKPSDRVSDDGLTFDHVDPEVANGMDNLVVACRGCNNRKGRRTPGQADMHLIDLQPPATGPVTVAGPVAGPVSAPGTGLLPEQRQAPGRGQIPTSPGRDGDGFGTAQPSGSTGPASRPPGQIGPPATARGTRSTSPYLRTQRPAPEDHAGHPATAAGGAQ